MNTDLLIQSTPSSEARNTKFTVETIYRIYTSSGSYLELAPTEEFEECLRIRQVNAVGGHLGDITADRGHLRKMAEVILKMTEEPSQ